MQMTVNAPAQGFTPICILQQQQLRATTEDLSAVPFGKVPVMHGAFIPDDDGNKLMTGRDVTGDCIAGEDLLLFFTASQAVGEHIELSLTFLN